MADKDSFNILVLSNWYPNRDQAFLGDFVQRHAHAITKKNEIQVVYIAPSNVSSKKVENSVFQGVKEKRIYFPKSRFSWVNFLKKSFYLRQELLNNKYDLIHLNTMYFHFWPLIFSSKSLVITEHFSGFLPENLDKMASWKRIFYQQLLNKAQAITTVSERMKTGLSRLARNKDIEVIPNVVDTDVFYSKNDSLLDTTFSFLHISNFSAVKNIPIILEAIENVAQKRTDFKFIFAGNGDPKEIHDYVEKHKLQNTIEILPALSHQEVAERMRQAQVFVLYSEYENQPCVIIESFSTGTPVISSDVGGVSENFPQGFGTLIKPNSARDLANVMLVYLDGEKSKSPTEMHEYVKANFSPERIAEQFDEVYKQAIQES